MSECPTCNRSFKNTHGMRIHHVQAHNKSLAGDDIECEWCGETFSVQRDKIDKRRFCSRDCEGEWRSETIQGEDHHRYNRVSVSCDWCDDEIVRPPSVIEAYEHNFCDEDCRVEWVAQENSGEGHYDYSRKQVECHTCGDVFQRPRNHRERTNRNFCSRVCYNEALTEDVTGEDNFNWRGGYKPYYGPTWLSQRRNAIERDDEQCQDCSLTRDEHYDEYGSDLEVHHITPIRTFTDTQKANKLSNLVTLCKPCHIERENG